MISPISKYVVAIVGPTAVGKTACSIELAKQFQTEIISADARQFYAAMPIGTGQPTSAEQQGIPHHFLAFLPVEAAYTAGRFAQEALRTLHNLFLHHQMVLVVGGSGLYVKALCEGLTTFPSVSPTIRKMLIALLGQKGLPYLTELLARRDPVYYKMVDLNNPHRVIRALEVCLGTGLPYSVLCQSPPEGSRNFQLICIGLWQEQAILCQHIEQRVEEMLQSGWLQEAEQLYPYRRANALQTIGYKELFDYIDGRYTFTDTVDQIKNNTKQYAKRQMTWFRKQTNITWYKPSEIEKASQDIARVLPTSRSAD